MSFKQVFAFLLCAVLLTGAVPAFAASATIEIPSASSAVSAPCNIRVLNGHLHLVSNFQTISSFDLRNTEITLLEQDGRLAVQFEEKGAAGATVLPLGSAQSVIFSGAFDTLTISDEIDSRYSVRLNGQMNICTVYGCPMLTVERDAVVGHLVLKDNRVRLNVENTAAVGTLYGASSSTVPAQAGTIETYLSAAPRQPMKYASQVRFNDEERTLSVISGDPSYTVAQCMTDVALYVRQVSNDRAVSGSWKCLSGDTTSSSGVYLYQFTPSSRSCNGQTLTVEFQSGGIQYRDYTTWRDVYGNNENVLDPNYRAGVPDRALPQEVPDGTPYSYSSKPDVRMHSGSQEEPEYVPTAVSGGYERSVTITLPHGLRDGDRLQFFCGDQMIALVDLYFEDSNLQKTYVLRTATMDKISAQLLRG